MNELGAAGIAVAGVLVLVGGLVWALVKLSGSAGGTRERLETLEEGRRIDAATDKARGNPLRRGRALWDRMRARAAADELRRDDPPTE